MNTLASSISSARSIRPALALAVIIVSIAAIASQYASTPLPASATLFTAFITIACCADAMTAFIFYTQARIARSVPLLLLSCGYVFSTLCIVVHAMAFPGVFSPAGLFENSQAAVWFWVWWHGGFPLFVIAYAMARGKVHDSVSLPNDRRISRAYPAFVVGVVAVVAGLLAMTVNGHVLPTLIREDDYRPLLSTGIGPAVMLAILGAIAALVFSTGLRRATDLWLAFALFASFADCALTLFAGGRYTVGWYMARFDSLIASTIVLLTFVAAVDRIFRKMAVLSRLDGLTGLSNRRAFDEDLENAIVVSSRANLPLSLLMIDVDYFKTYNDTYGHQRGDEALRMIAGCIGKSLTRRSDSCARYGGEEFAVVLPMTDLDGAAKVAEKIRSVVIRCGIEHAGSPTRKMTVSIGSSTLVAADLRDRSTPERLVEMADRALYVAKHDGRNCVKNGSTLSLPLTRDCA